MSGIRKVVGLTNIPPPSPALMDRVRRSEAAEEAGTIHELFEEKPEKITRPSLRAVTLEERARAKAIGSVDAKYQEGIDGRWAIADAEPFGGGVKLEAAWDLLTEGQKVAAGVTERFRLEMEAQLSRLALREDLPHQVSGHLDKRNVERSLANALARIQGFEYLLAPDSRELLKRFMQSTAQQLGACVSQDLVKGVNAEAAHDLLQDLANKLIYQELVSRRRRLGDRGIRHIVAVADIAEQVLAYASNFTPITLRHALLSRFIAAHHDLGYTAFAARVSFRGGKLHRAYSVRIFTDEIARYRAIFSAEEIDLMRTAIATHSAASFPFISDPVLAAIRVADHLSPFSHTKLYTYFNELPELHDYLIDLSAAMHDEDVPRWFAMRDALIDQIFALEIPGPLKDDLAASFRPLSPAKSLPEYQARIASLPTEDPTAAPAASEERPRAAEIAPVHLGRCAGVVGAGIDFNGSAGGEGELVVAFQADPLAYRFQELFDCGQEQFLRLCRTCAVEQPTVAAGGELRIQAEEQRGSLRLVFPSYPDNP